MDTVTLFRGVTKLPAEKAPGEIVIPLEFATGCGMLEGRVGCGNVTLESWLNWMWVANGSALAKDTGSSGAGGITGGLLISERFESSV